MKRFFKLFCLLFVCICFCNINVFAAVKTYDRTPENNYLVTGKDIVVDDNKIPSILSTPAVDASLKVYDFAGLYSDAAERRIYSLVANYIDKHNMDLAIVTISDNVKGNAQVYAQDFYDYNDFGIGDNFDGVIFLVDMDTREFYMSTNGAAIKMYNDNRIDNILDSITNYFVDGDYDDGTIKFIEKIEYYASVGYPSADGSEPKVPRVTGIARLKMLHWPSIFIFSIAATAFVMYILISNNKLARQANSSRHYLTKADISKRDEIFMGKNIHHTARVDSSSSGGGSSISRGSSGRSHGGGGRKF